MVLRPAPVGKVPFSGHALLRFFPSSFHLPPLHRPPVPPPVRSNFPTSPCGVGSRPLMPPPILFLFQRLLGSARRLKQSQRMATYRGSLFPLGVPCESDGLFSPSFSSRSPSKENPVAVQDAFAFLGPPFWLEVPFLGVRFFLKRAAPLSPRNQPSPPRMFPNL